MLYREGLHEGVLRGLDRVTGTRAALSRKFARFSGLRGATLSPQRRIDLSASAGR
jgi:hypothetical protein